MANKNIMESDAASVKLQYKANSLVCVSILPSHQSCGEGQSYADFDEYPNLTNRAPSCQQRFTSQQAITLASASALYQTPYIIPRYTKRREWDSVISAWRPKQNTPSGKRFPLSTQSYHKRPPWDRPPCTFLTASTSTRFAVPEIHRAMITLWNAAHTSTKKLPKLLQKGIGGMKS